MSEPTLRKAGATVVTFVILAKVIGLVREVVVAGTFGTSRIVDTYLAAIIIPAIICNIVYQGLPNAFIPLFTENARSPVGRRLAVLLLGASLGVAVAVWLTAPWTASLTNSGFPVALKQDTVNLVRIGSLAIFLATIEALARSRLIAQKRFVQSGSAAIWSSTIIVAAVVFYAEAGAYALMWGYVIGMAAVAIWNLLPLRKQPTNQSEAATAPQTSFGDSWIFVVLTVSTVGLLNGLIDRHLGSFLAEGSLAALQYADLVASQPVAILGIALAGAIFPYLAKAVQSDDVATAQAILNSAIRWSLLAIIPIGLILVFFAVPVVRVLFERGEFNDVSRGMTGSVLSVYGLWMIPTVLAAIIAKVHYSMRRARPLLVGIVLALVIKLILSIWLVTPYGISGLAMASLAGSLVYLGMLTGYLHNWGWRQIWHGWLQLAAVLLGLTLAGCGVTLLVALTPAFPGDTMGAFVTLVVAGLVICALVIGVGAKLGIPESKRITQMIAGQMTRTFTH